MATTTVVKTIGSGGDFTTLQSWEDVKPLDLTETRSSTTRAGSTSSTIVLDASASATAGAYVGHAVYCNARPTEKRLVTAYNETTQTATIGALNGSSSTWANTPGTEAYTIDGCVWQGQIKNASDYFVGATFANILTVSGSTTDDSNYAELTTAPGASFRDHATAPTNPLRFDPSQGCAMQGTPAYTNLVQWIGEIGGRISNLQFYTDSYGGGGSSLTFQYCTVSNCIFDYAVNLPNIIRDGSLINCLCISRGGSYGLQCGQGGLPGPISLIGCTIISISPGNIGIGASYENMVMRNCAVFNFPTPVANQGGANTWTINKCATDVASIDSLYSPSEWTVSVPFTGATFQSLTGNSLTSDFRLVAGSALIGIGATDATYLPTDIIGTARPQGTGFDIGCWEFAGSAAPTILSRRTLRQRTGSRAA